MKNTAPASDKLLIALIHLNVRHGQNARNRENIVRLAQQAAERGAKIAVAPEMGLSGYSYPNREAIAARVETRDGPSAKAFAKAAKEFKIYLVTAFAERDEPSGLFYNSAFVHDPRGELVCHYRKINAESRWATPGLTRQNNVFSTPWGKMGLLICSDSYHSLPSRVTALKGARLLFLPSNWPPSQQFPEDIWRFRAMENGLWCVPVNRTGHDGRDNDFDCQSAASYVFDPQGHEQLKVVSPSSELALFEIRLDSQGEIVGRERQRAILRSRRPQDYYRLAANLLLFEDITESFRLPKPAPIDVYFVAPGENQNPLPFLEKRLSRVLPRTLIVLPLHDYRPDDWQWLGNACRERKLRAIAATETEGRRTHVVFNETDAPVSVPPDSREPLLFLGPLAIHLTTLAGLRHPEVGLSAAKWGADLLLALERECLPDDPFVVSLRPIDQLAAAFCAGNGAALGLIPEGHFPGRGFSTPARGAFSYCLNPERLRKKKFQDRVDYATLFGGGDVDPSLALPPEKEKREKKRGQSPA
ncbi:MAG: carbon-nitrogen hydrolase family protein [Deltaproteobacteria bacterium]|jgi:predicted amidohydrolase|nr:carbon-nitrogen hydrolase family protein [Deltaproteobacteria bacterium]